MTLKEIKKAEKMLNGRIERSCVMAYEHGLCLSVEFIGGWSKIFYTLTGVVEWIESHSATA